MEYNLKDMSQPMPPLKPILVNGCARCGESHDVVFREFRRMSGQHSHWGTCPVTNEPILMRLVLNTDE